MKNAYWQAKVTGEDISRLNFLISAVGGFLGLVLVAVLLCLAADGNPFQVP